LKPEEAQVLAKLFANPPPATISVDGTAYPLTYGYDDRMGGELGKTGVYVFKTARGT